VAEREFRSRLEDLVPAEELLFPPTPAFGRYRPFLEHAVAHPAKANTRLLEFLIEKYTRPGDVVLDPMAGTGSTGVVAALHGRNAVQVEIEEKFYEWMERAREKVEKHQTLAPKGRIVNIRGDARRLSELLSRADVVITSPPYEGSLEGTTRHTRGGIPSRDPTLAQTGTYAVVLPGAGEDAPASPSPDNIGNLKSSDEEYEALNRGLIKGDRPTYLSEMLRVYSEIHKVLKPNGLAIIIVKPFIRNKRVVDLPWYTWLLMSKVGFKLEKLYKLRLKNLSFWRALYWRKYPEVPRISHEYVIVARKSDHTPH